VKLPVLILCLAAQLFIFFCTRSECRKTERDHTASQVPIQQEDEREIRSAGHEDRQDE